MSTVQQELDQLGNNPSLSDLQSAIGRIQSDLGTTSDRIRAAERFLGAAAEQLGLPGLYTLPNGNKFVPAGEDRSRGSTGVDDARYLARVGLLPDGTRERIEQNFSWNDDFEPLPGTETDVANRPPRTERRLQSSGSLSNANLSDVRSGPYVDIERQGEPVRVFADVERLEQFADRYGYTADDIVDPDAPQDEPGDNDAQDGAGTNSGNDGSDAEDNDTDDTDSPEQEIYQSLEDFATSNLGGLRNDRNQEPAIRELQTFLSTELGLDTGGVDGRYGPRTTAAVRRFQGALTDIAIDGDAGPETIGKIQEIRTDMERMQELVNALNESSLPFRLKSGLAQLLERDLTQAERTELEQLVNKYENFKQEFPEFKQEIFSRAQTFISDRPTDQEEPGIIRNPTTATNPEVLPGEGQPVDAPVVVQALGDIPEPDNPVPGQTGASGVRNPVTYGASPTLVNGIPSIVNSSLSVLGNSLTQRNAQAFRDTLNYDILTRDMSQSIVREIDRLYPLSDISDAILGNDISEDERLALGILLNARLALIEIDRTEYQPPASQPNSQEPAPAPTSTESPPTTTDDDPGVLDRLPLESSDLNRIKTLTSKLLER